MGRHHKHGEEEEKGESSKERDISGEGILMCVNGIIMITLLKSGVF